MTFRVFASALIAGVLAGLFAAAMQLAFTQPLLLEGELYETGARVHFSASGSAQSDAGFTGPVFYFARNLQSAAMAVVTFCAFGLMMLAGFAAAEMTGQARAIDARAGVIWGLCGFIAVQLAPSMGLAPELPGTIAADLSARLIWWSSTIVLTLVGLWLVCLSRGFKVAIGIALIAVPHIWGAPQLDTYFGVAPAELGAAFSARVLGVGMATWALLGGLAGHFWSRFNG